MNRRTFLRSIAIAAALPLVPAAVLKAPEISGMSLMPKTTTGQAMSVETGVPQITIKQMMANTAEKLRAQRQLEEILFPEPTKLWC